MYMLMQIFHFSFYAGHTFFSFFDIIIIGSIVYNNINEYTYVPDGKTYAGEINHEYI